jgi:hypothetical protein
MAPGLLALGDICTLVPSGVVGVPAAPAAVGAPTARAGPAYNPEEDQRGQSDADQGEDPREEGQVAQQATGAGFLEEEAPVPRWP